MPHRRATAASRRRRDKRQPRISSGPDSISTDSTISTKVVDVDAALEHLEETAHAVLAVKLEGRDAAAPRSLDVLRAVIDEHARPTADSLLEIAIETLVRLRRPDEPRQHDRVKPAHERKSPIEERDMLRRIVRQRVQPIAARGKRLEALDGVVERAGE